MLPKHILESIGPIALFVAMLGTGAFAWSLHLVPELHVDTAALAELPSQIGQWQSTSIPMEPAVEAELQADFHVQRAYSSRLGPPVWLYVGYYGTDRGGRPEHTPRGCYTGAGWGIESSRIIDIGAELRIQEYLIEREQERRLVHFWYRSHRGTGLVSGFERNVDRLLGRLLDGRADGALIRISTIIIGDGLTSARGQLLSFATLVDPIIGERWPNESSCQNNGPDAKGCSTLSAIQTIQVDHIFADDDNRQTDAT